MLRYWLFVLIREGIWVSYEGDAVNRIGIGLMRNQMTNGWCEGIKIQSHGDA
jgi:hypothetical protein